MMKRVRTPLTPLKGEDCSKSAKAQARSPRAFQERIIGRRYYLLPTNNTRAAREPFGRSKWFQDPSDSP